MRKPGEMYLATLHSDKLCAASTPVSRRDRRLPRDPREWLACLSAIKLVQKQPVRDLGVSTG